ncbi:Predicted dehydrogenase [Catalinimonas alkaloidigena]|uniref:Predicted dehydrogenase n=1 Tax=Catalinimonas alkaloidigena TaxID=1075417 RepID=A0A1G9NWE8_9BACT|nr:Gfo/Idh/MocA family oxidoreductase [Catalinimonas alkaloidigena]SDL90898.1 Predicted dehydrogenase [Catalinimonas alkaloidigena]
MSHHRREFLKKSVVGTAGLALGVNALGASTFGSAFAASPQSYRRILGANDRIHLAVIGTNNRGKAHITAISKGNNAEVAYICDVDSKVLESTLTEVKQKTGKTPKGEKDIRRLLDQKNLDAITIATPEHWHAPMALMGVQAGKHVYVEKPCSHNPREGEMLVEAQKRYGKLIQMGNQQRSAPTSIQAVKDIREGIIGTPYFGKAWYSNNRKPIGNGNEVAPPAWLDWELWQGPAPREAYRDNVVHYNWHWFKNWGTGEIHNNGTHEIDVCRWALGVDYPTKVSASGGRYHYQGDDWEFPDTQVVSYEFPDNKMITWEGKSCNPFNFYDRGRGATIHGSEGTVMLDRNGYWAYDMDGKLIKEVLEKAESATTNTLGEGALDIFHMNNFFDGIRSGQALHSPIADAHISTLLCHLGNISQFVGRSLSCNPKTGHIQGDMEAMKYWSRQYAPGWEPSV